MSSPPKCKLCKQGKILVESHVIPKFVISWLKKTGSGFFRKPISPNIKYQDFNKQRILCYNCEQLFSAGEKYFSENIFYPYINLKSKQLSYSKALHYFLVSVLWRILVVQFDLYKKECRKFLKELEENEEDWRLYLLGERATIKSDVHLFLTDILDSDTIPVKGFNQYIARGIDGTVTASQTDCYVYCKFARFVVFSQLTKYDLSKWKNTKINNGTGVLVTPQEILDGRIGEFLVTRIRGLRQMYNKQLSSRQKERIHEHQQKNIDEIINSDLGDAILKDSFSTIDNSFFPKGKIRRNQLCPCGSGLKYKKCCGV